MKIPDSGLVWIALGKGRVTKPDDMVCMPKFGQPRESTDELLAARTQSKRKYGPVIKMKLCFAALSARLVHARVKISIHCHDMDART